RYSTLVAKNGGTIQSPALKTLVGVNIVLDGTGSMPTSQITSLDVDSALTLSGVGASYNFDSLTTAKTSIISLDGAAVSLPNLAQIDGTSLLVSGGSTLALPSVTSYTNTTTGNNITRTLQVTGSGSVLDLHNVTTVTNGQNFNADL